MRHSRREKEIATASPTIIDAHVGNRIRLRRRALGLPRTEVAKNLGISWQQLGKYERARDRTSASMLYLISSALWVTVDFFFAEFQLDDKNEHPAERLRTSAIKGVLTPDARGHHVGQLIAAYWRIKDTKQRRHILDLVQALGGQIETPKPDTKSSPEMV